jgi:protein transport protein SEC24
MISENLKLLPIYTLGMLKNTAFRDTNTISSDMRSYMLALHYILCTEIALVNLYPCFYSLQSLQQDPKVFECLL